jgi:hypothetical protein
MGDRARSNHIHIDVHETLAKMLAGFNGRGMVSVFPEGAFAAFTAIELLGRSAGRQLDRTCDRLCATAIFYQ